MIRKPGRETVPPGIRLDEDPDAEFLRRYDPTAFPRPSVAVDVVLLTVRGRELHLLLVRRSKPPEAGKWALPGGFVGIDEDLDAAANRVLDEKAGVRGVFVEQFHTFGKPERDRRMRIISVAYFALVDLGRFPVVGAEGNVRSAAIRMPGKDGPCGSAEVVDEAGRSLPLAFDHAAILETAVRQVRARLRDASVGFELLPETFTLPELQQVHEAIAGEPTNKDSFRRRMVGLDVLEPTGATRQFVGRPAMLYRYVGPSESRRSTRLPGKLTSPGPERGPDPGRPIRKPPAGRIR